MTCLPLAARSPQRRDSSSRTGSIWVAWFVKSKLCLLAFIVLALLSGLLSVLTLSMAASWHHPWDPGPLSHADHLTCCHIVTPHNQLTGITQTHWFRSSATLKQKRLTIWGYVHSVCHTVDHRWNWYVSKKYRKTRLIISSKSITYGTVLVYTTSKDHVVSKTVSCCLLAGPSRHFGSC